MKLVYQTENGATRAISVTDAEKTQRLIDTNRKFKIKGQPVTLIGLMPDDEWNKLQILTKPTTSAYELWKKTGAYMRRYHQYPTKEQLDNFHE